MIVAVLLFTGLCLGSFVNALVWRLHVQAETAGAAEHKKLSIFAGRSRCPGCRHQLAFNDLVPVISWLKLRGKCRYCGRPISTQYPLVELATAGLFVVSYIWWPAAFDAGQTVVFVCWLLLLTGLMALLVYDLRWQLLPNRLIYPLTGLAGVQAAAIVATAPDPVYTLVNMLLAVAVGGGLFYILFQISGGKWIGGGDVKLGWLLGLIAATPARSLLIIFIAALLGSLVSLPLLAADRLKRSSTIPFGPFLIVALIIVQFFGSDVLDWYQRAFLGL